MVLDYATTTALGKTHWKHADLLGFLECNHMQEALWQMAKPLSLSSTLYISCNTKKNDKHDRMTLSNALPVIHDCQLLDNLTNTSSTMKFHNILRAIWLLVSHHWKTNQNRKCSRKLKQLDGLMQERHNSIANALELCLSCTNPLKYNQFVYQHCACWWHSCQFLR